MNGRGAFCAIWFILPLLIPCSFPSIWCYQISIALIALLQCKIWQETLAVSFFTHMLLNTDFNICDFYLPLEVWSFGMMVGCCIQLGVYSEQWPGSSSARY